MIDSRFREKYQAVLINPLLRVNWIAKVKPSRVSFIALCFGLLSALFIAFGYSYLACALLIFSGYLDTLDGSIARAFEKVSPSGAALDIFFDRCVEFAIILGLFYVNSQVRGALCLIMLGSILLCITSFLVVGIFEQNESEKSFHYSVGIMERTEAFIFFCAMILLPSLFVYLSITFSMLVLITALIRISQFTKPNV
ncbi:MAG: CDP-alcohol phosphatidyltransferase family protein [Rhabdochlamydiaceae bacterium]|nr:CDP-alcohol phosphatidyltransferase family protein [Candidatus Amphrikana amoebophyrae]